MEYQSNISRRDFLSALAGIGLSGIVASSCSPSEKQPVYNPATRLKAPITLDETNYIDLFKDCKPDSYVLINIGQKGSQTEKVFDELSARYDPKDVLFLQCNPEFTPVLTAKLGVDLKSPSILMVYKDMKTSYDQPFDNVEGLRNTLESAITQYSPGKNRYSTGNSFRSYQK